MTDQCMNCTVRGDIAACRVTPCHKHDDWYSKQLQAELDAAKAHIAELKAAGSHLAGQMVGFATNNSKGFIVSECADYDRVANKTPAQSLASIKAQAINDLISEKMVNVYIEGTEWPVVYVEDAHAYSAKIGGGE